MKDLINKATQKAQAGVDYAGSIFESLPVIGDYQNKERRREADRRLRESIAVSLEAARKRIVEIERMLLNKGKLTDLPYVDIAANRLQNIIDRIRTAPSGYAGFFDLERIREPELEKLHQFDERIATSVPEINSQIDAMQQSIEDGEGYSQQLTTLLRTIDDLDERLDHRKEAIRAVGNEAAPISETSSVEPEASGDATGDEPVDTTDNH